MRVLFTTTGTAGHLLPLVPIARACLRAGHEVCVATQRSRGDDVTQAGLPLLTFDGPPDDARDPIMAATAGLTVEEANQRVVGDLFARVNTRAALPGLLHIVDSWRPTVIVRESYEFAGGLAAELRGIPHLRVGLGLARTEAWAVGLAEAVLAELRAELGLPDDPQAEHLLASPYLTLVPPALEDPTVPGPSSALRFHTIGPSPVAPSPDRWPENDQPLVYVTFGSVASVLGHFPGLYRAAIDALTTVPARVLVTTGHAADPSTLGAVPPNVHVERWVSQEQILGHAAAVVCHGGFGTTLAALSHGLPVVTLPLFASDQWQLSRRVAETGAGIALPADPEAGRRAHDPPGGEAMASLPEAVQRVLEESAHRNAARAVASAIAALPPVDAAVDMLCESTR